MGAYDSGFNPMTEGNLGFAPDDVAKRMYGASLGFPQQAAQRPPGMQTGQPQGNDLLSLLAGVTPQYTDPSEDDEKAIFKKAMLMAGAAMLSAPLGEFSKGMGDAFSAFGATREGLRERNMDRSDSRAESTARGEYNQGILKNQQDQSNTSASNAAIKEQETADLRDIYREQGVPVDDNDTEKVMKAKEGQMIAAQAQKDALEQIEIAKQMLVAGGMEENAAIAMASQSAEQIIKESTSQALGGMYGDPEQKGMGEVELRSYMSELRGNPLDPKDDYISTQDLDMAERLTNAGNYEQAASILQQSLKTNFRAESRPETMLVDMFGKEYMAAAREFGADSPEAMFAAGLFVQSGGDPEIIKAANIKIQAEMP